MTEIDEGLVDGRPQPIIPPTLPIDPEPTPEPDPETPKEEEDDQDDSVVAP